MTRKVGAITIGQSPRVDVVPEIKEILGDSIEVLEAGALDGLTCEEIAALAPGPGDYVLVTRLRDGSSVRIAEEKILPLMQARIDGVVAAGAEAVLLLCTGEFPPFSCRRLILKPQLILHHFTAAVATGRRLGVIVPDAGQVEETRKRWAGVGSDLAVEAASPYGPVDAIWEAAARLQAWQAELIVLDCIGFNMSMKREINRRTGIPVILPRAVAARTLIELVS